MSLSFYVISSQCKFSNRKKQLCQGRTHWSSFFSLDTTSTDHCARTCSSQYRTHVPHLYFTCLPISQFYHHPPPFFRVNSNLPVLKLPWYAHSRKFPTFQHLINIFNNFRWRRRSCSQFLYFLESTSNFPRGGITKSHLLFIIVPSDFQKK